MALITFIDGDKHCFKSRLNMMFTEAPRSVAFCSLCYLNVSSPIFIIEDACTDANYATHPHVTGYPFARFYAGASIFVQGIKVGVLCVIDQQPHLNFSNMEQEILADLAKCVTDLILLRRQEMFEDVGHCVILHQIVLSTIREPLTRAIESKEWIAGIFGQIKFSTSPGSCNELIIVLNAAKDALLNNIQYLDTIIHTEIEVLLFLIQLRIPFTSVAVFKQNNTYNALMQTEKWKEIFLKICFISKVVNVTPVFNIASELIEIYPDQLFLSFCALLGFLVPFYTISTIEVYYEDAESDFTGIQVLEKNSASFFEATLHVDILYEENDMRQRAISPQSFSKMITSLHHVLQSVQGSLVHDSIYQQYRLNMPCKLISNRVI